MATAVKMPVCSAKVWSERCHKAIDDFATTTECDHPASFRSTMIRSISFPSEPAQRVPFLLVNKKKKLREVGAQRSAAKSAKCPVRSRSCTEMLQVPASSPRSPLKLNLSAVALYQPASPVQSRLSDMADDTGSGMPSPPWKQSKEDSPIGAVHFQLEDIEEDGLTCTCRSGSLNDSSDV